MPFGLASTGGMSRAEHARWKSKIQAQMHREAVAAQRAKVAALRVAVRATKARKREALKAHRERCKVNRARLREIIKQRKATVRAELALEVDELRTAARNRCAARRLDITESGKSAEAKARARLKVALDNKREMVRIGKIKTERKSLATRAERRAESDEKVRANIESIDPRWVPIWEKMKRQIKAKPRLSRTEAFLEWAHHSAEEIADMESTDEAAMLSSLERELEAEQRKQARWEQDKDRAHKAELKRQAEKRIQSVAQVARKKAKAGPGMSRADAARLLLMRPPPPGAELEAAPF